VIPAGLAFARSVSQRPDINLYVADKRDPSLAGTYWPRPPATRRYSSVRPVGSSYTAGLEPALARHLQTVAWETVQDYHRR